MGEPRPDLADLLRRALKDHDAITAALRTGGTSARLFGAVDDMGEVKAAAVELGCYPGPSSILRGGASPEGEHATSENENAAAGEGDPHG